MKPITRARVVGAGNMGIGIATDLALAGVDVELIARRAARRDIALTELESLADELSNAGVSDPAWLARIRVEPTALSEAPDVIIEAIVEKADQKNALFMALQDELPEVPIWSTTSAIPASAMVSGLPNPGQVIVTHYANPAHLMPIVEVVPGPETDESVTTDCLSELSRFGKRPVLIRGEPPGFVFNRLQYAVMREAVSLVSRGVVNASDLDAVVTHGYGLRLPVVGPFAMVDLSTLEVYARIANLILPDLADDKEIPQLDEMIAEGKTFLEWQPGQQDAVRKALRRELLQRLAQQTQGIS